MTEKETIEVLLKNVPKCCELVDGRYQGGFDDWDCDMGQAIRVAVLALQEIQQYRAIGTVEECREAVSGIKTQKYCEKVHKEMFVINSDLAKYFFDKNMMVFKLYDNDYCHITYLDELLEHSARGGLFGIEKYDLDEII